MVGEVTPQRKDYMPSLEDIQKEAQIAMHESVVGDVHAYNLMFRSMDARKAAAKIPGVGDFSHDADSEGFTQEAATLIVQAVIAELAGKGEQRDQLVAQLKEIPLRVRA